MLDTDLLDVSFQGGPLRALPYHLAAYAAEGLSHFIKRFNYENNLVGSVNLINRAVNHDVSRFVFTSSIAVYGVQDELPMTEAMRPRPEDPYGIAKYAVEMELTASHDMFGLEHVIFRPHNVYGSRQNIGDRYRNVIGIFMNQIMRGEPMTIFGDGSQTRAFSHVGEIASAIARSPEVPAATCQVFNVGADRPYTVLELAHAVAEAMGVEPDVRHLDQRSEVQHAWCSHEKAHLGLRDPAPVDLVDGCAHGGVGAKRRPGARVRASARSRSSAGCCPPGARSVTAPPESRGSSRCGPPAVPATEGAGDPRVACPDMIVGRSPSCPEGRVPPRAIPVLRMKTKVYLADLRHNFGGVLSTDRMPLGLGFMKAVMDRELPASEVESRLFAYPNDLLEAMRESPPDVLMVSNYVWNEELSHFFVRLAKKLNPACLTVMGGPNISMEPERQIAYFRGRPQLDLYLTGEGDFMATHIVREFVDAGRSVQRLGERDLPSSIYRRGTNGDGEILRTETSGRSRDIDEIPSPYLTGIMDQFFDGKLAPMIETNRGCPFRCAFCVQGTTFYTKVYYFDQERLRQEIEYIARINHERSPHMGVLRIADPNYGMYERDVEISGYIGEMQARYGWPTFIDATTGKNKPERIIESMEKVNGALVLYQAVQSLDEEVLRNIDRANIKLDSYEKIQVHIRSRGMRSMSDLILGLPGESLVSHLKGMHTLIDAGTNQAHCFQSMMLKGASLETEETRSKFRFDTRFRVLPKNYGIYDGERVFDIEEIVVATDTLPFDDYVTCRKHHLAFSIFWNDSWFTPVVEWVGHFGIKPSEWLTAMLGTMEDSDGPGHRLLEDFVRETKGELFPTRQACADFYAQDENFERLRRGEIGDNLMYKYRAKASFFDWKDVCACAMEGTKRLMLEHGAGEIEGFDEFFDDLAAYVEALHASGGSAEEIKRPVEVDLRYDVQAWREAGHPKEVAPFRLSEPKRFVLNPTPEGAKELQSASTSDVEAERPHEARDAHPGEFAGARVGPRLVRARTS
ncbi:MAG: NAD-dependent epimerase/dehydratase family protein [Planctomycetota bacterium]